MKLFGTLALLAALALPAQAATTQKARLAILDLAPFTVHGTGFAARERVTVVALVDGRHVHTLTATVSGRFTTRFLSVQAGPCTPYRVRATGGDGSRASLTLIPECAPPDVLYPIDPIPKHG